MFSTGKDESVLCATVISGVKLILHSLLCSSLHPKFLPCIRSAVYSLVLYTVSHQSVAHAEVLTFQTLAFTCASAYRKKSLEIHFIYLGNKEIYCIFKTCCIISVLFSTKCRLCHNFIFFCSNNMFFINHVLKFQYLPLQDRGKVIKKVGRKGDSSIQN
jgi:hypothetical protein